LSADVTRKQTTSVELEFVVGVRQMQACYTKPESQTKYFLAFSIRHAVDASITTSRELSGM
jgi:hypothetical protein